MTSNFEETHAEELPAGISAVVPVYNSAPTLPRLLQELTAALSKITDNFEIVLVNDASADGSWQIICDLKSHYPQMRAINLSRNYGQHNALLCGIRHARYSVIVTLDDDLQNPPSEIVKLVRKLDEGFDVVYGVREKETHGLLRNMASVITKLVLQKAMGAEIARSITSFRAFHTDLRDEFATYSSPYVLVDILFTWATSSFGVVKVKHLPREAGKSNYSLGKLITHGTNIVTGFSIIPLQLSSVTGFIFLLFGLGALAYVLYSYFAYGGAKVPGFYFLACVILVFSAAQLLALGIIGEYLARMYARSMGRPSYRIRKARTKSPITKASELKIK